MTQLMVSYGVTEKDGIRIGTMKLKIQTQTPGGNVCGWTVGHCSSLNSDAFAYNRNHTAASDSS